MLHKIAFVLLIIGGLNWLLEAFHYGIGNYLPWNVAMIIYILVGILLKPLWSTLQRSLWNDVRPELEQQDLWLEQ